MIYEPQEDSYLLNKYVRKFVSGRVLDMGTGSGLQAMAALENTEDVLASDSDAECVEYVRKKGVKVVQSDLFSNIDGKFDWIIFNPPYLPEDSSEPEDSRTITTGGKNGDEILKRFLAEAKSHMTAEGKILLVISSLTGKPDDLFSGYVWQCLETENLFMESISVYLLSLS